MVEPGQVIEKGCCRALALPEENTRLSEASKKDMKLMAHPASPLIMAKGTVEGGKGMPRGQAHWIGVGGAGLGEGP